MKNLFLPILLISFMCQSNAQEWAPVGAKWHYSESIFDGLPVIEGFLKFEVEKDTVFQGELCRKLIKHRKVFCNDRPETEFTFERNDSVFFWNPHFDDFIMLYNFNAEINEFWDIKITNKYMPEPDVDTIRVHIDSAKFIDIGELKLKTLYVTYQNISQGYIIQEYQGTIIEKFGDMTYMFNYEPVWSMVCDGNKGTGLRCYSDGDIGFYETGIATSCEEVVIWNHLNDNKVQDTHTAIHINRKEKHLSISDNTSANLQYSIYDFGSNLISKGYIVNNRISIQKIKPGFYICVLHDQNKRPVIIKKFIIY